MHSWLEGHQSHQLRKSYEVASSLCVVEHWEGLLSVFAELGFVMFHELDGCSSTLVLEDPQVDVD